MTNKSDYSVSFNENYKLLQEIAEKLRNQDTPDIDSLVPMVEQATKSYKACKSRLEAVKLALEEHLAKEIDE